MPEPADFESQPLTRREYIAAMAHFYRGEMARSIFWRQRLDATTNWALVTAAGMISFAFTNPHNSHLIILVTNLTVLSFLVIEARRYRYFEVFRARVRMLEENFLIPMITRRLESPMAGWREAVAADLDAPKFKTTVFDAMGFRLRRNYAIIFGFVFGGWMLKIYVQPHIAHSLREVWDRIAVGNFPSWAVLGLGCLFYALLVFLAVKGSHIHGPDPDDEVVGLEKNLDNWKL
jgi:uncharacterized membrane protein